MKVLNDPKEIERNNSEEILSRVGKIKHVALDMDGTIYNGSTLFPFTIPFLDQMRKNGIKCSFLTNNPSKNTSDYVEHLAEMGIHITEDEIYTSAKATIDFLKNNFPAYKRLFILGTPNMIREFEKAGFISAADSESDVPDAVVVGFDMSLTYARLCRAAWWISQNKPYFATNPDRVCPTDKQTVLVDCGSICASLEQATGRTPDVVIGKPDPRMLDGILERYHLQPNEVAMVGDRIYTDVMMAYNAHALGVLVLSGETTLDTAQKADPRPDIIASDLEEFGRIIMAATSF